MLKETLDLKTVMEAVVEWRSVWMATGVQCVMMAGTAMMPTQCADNWDTMKLVNSMKIRCMYTYFYYYYCDN